MANVILKVFATTAAKLNQLQVTDGQLIFCRDTRQIYLDINGTRLGYNTIQVFPSDKERLQILAPVEGFYFVESTNVFWRYFQGWKQISPSNIEPLFFGNLEDFPQQGNPTTLYITDDATYKWSSSSETYIIIANKTEWIQLGE